MLVADVPSTTAGSKLCATGNTTHGVTWGGVYKVFAALRGVLDTPHTR